jgi:hypothetical protein
MRRALPFRSPAIELIPYSSIRQPKSLLPHVLSKVCDGVSLIWANGLSVHQFSICVSWPNDVPVGNDAQCLKALAGTKVPTPSGTDSIGAAPYSAVVLGRGVGSEDNVAAVLDGAAVIGVNAELVGALGVVGRASAGE